jgi:integrase/recombinase XerD
MIVDSKKVKKRERPLNNYYQNYIDTFKKWLIRLGYAPSTVKSNTYKLRYFFNELQSLQITTIYQIEPHHIVNYHKKLNKQCLSTTYIRSCLLAIKNFNKFIQNTEHYTIGFSAVTIEQQIPNVRDILTKKEVNTLFKSLDDSPISMRDKAMLHLLYSCGLRCEEVTKVRIKDLDYHKQLLYVQPGKTRQGRYVPIHSKVVCVLRDYEHYARPVINPKGYYFLVGSKTQNFTTKTVRRSLKRILEPTAITKTITPHCLRHSIATHLLEQGVKIEHIKQFLGHQNLQTTQRYVRVTLKDDLVK